MKTYYRIHCCCIFCDISSWCKKSTQLIFNWLSEVLLVHGSKFYKLVKDNCVLEKYNFFSRHSILWKFYCMYIAEIYWGADENNTSGSQRMPVNVPPGYLVFDFLLWFSTGGLAIWTPRFASCQVYAFTIHYSIRIKKHSVSISLVQGRGLVNFKLSFIQGYTPNVAFGLATW